MPVNQQCQGLIGRWFGHRMRPRYTVQLPEGWRFDVTSMTLYAGKELIDAVKERHYIRDVCTRCGYTVHQGEEE